MFITEQQLALYKYQPQSRYYNRPMSEIVYSEFNLFMKSIQYKHDDIINLFEYFLHKRINKTTWQYYFSDGSFLTIVSKNEKEYQIIASNYGFNDAVVGSP